MCCQQGANNSRVPGADNRAKATQRGLQPEGSLGGEGREVGREGGGGVGVFKRQYQMEPRLATSLRQDRKGYDRQLRVENASLQLYSVRNLACQMHTVKI